MKQIDLCFMIFRVGQRDLGRPLIIYPTNIEEVSCQEFTEKRQQFLEIVKPPLKILYDITSYKLVSAPLAVNVIIITAQW